MRKSLNPYSWSLIGIRNVLILVLVGMLTVAVLLVYSTEKEVVWAEATRVGTDRQIMALAGAKRIEAFFQRVETDLQIFSHTEVAVELEKGQALELMEQMVDRYEGTPLVSVVRVSREGRVVLSVNRQRLPVLEGVDVSDRDYFIWAKQQTSNTKVFLSTPLVAKAGPLVGKQAIIVTIPVFQNGEFDGLVFASIDLEKLITDYVASLTTYQGTEALLIDEEGLVLSGFLGKDIPGQNAKESFKQQYADVQEKYEDYLKEVLSGRNSWMQLELYFPDETQRQKWIMGFAPVKFGGRMWSLIVMVSYDEVFGRLENYQRIMRFSLIFVGLVVVVIGGLSILSMRKAEVVWYKRGFEKCKRALKLEKKKTDGR